MTVLLSSNLRQLLEESVLNNDDLDVSCKLAGDMLDHTEPLTPGSVIDVLIEIQKNALAVLELAIEDNLSQLKTAFGSEYKYDPTNDDSDFGQTYRMHQTITLVIETLLKQRSMLSEKSTDEVMHMFSMPSVVMDLYRSGYVQTNVDLLVLLLMSNNIKGLNVAQDRSEMIAWIEEYVQGQRVANYSGVDELLINIGWSGNEELTAVSLVSLTLDTNHYLLRKIELQIAEGKNQAELLQLEKTKKMIENVMYTYESNFESMVRMMQERFNKGLNYVFIDQGLPDPILKNVEILTVRQYLDIYTQLSKNK